MVKFIDNFDSVMVNFMVKKLSLLKSILDTVDSSNNNYEKIEQTVF